MRKIKLWTCRIFGCLDDVAATFMQDGNWFSDSKCPRCGTRSWWTQ